MGIGTPTEGFECHIYISRRLPDRDWIVDVCHTLWRHGMKFLTPHLLVGTWDEQLQTLPPFQPETGKPLIHQIDDIAESGSGRLACYDCNVDFDLYIDTNLREVESMGYGQDFSSEQQAALERSRLGKLTLYVRYPAISIDHRLPASLVDQVPVSAYLIPPYQHVHIAMLRWLEILCTKLQAVFAVGYYMTNSYLAPDEDFLYKFDIATVTALSQDQFPSLRDWLSNIYVLYTPEHLMKFPQAEEWFSSPLMWKRQLSNGAWLAYSMPETLDEIRAKEFNAACEALLQRRDRTQLPLARIYLQRAQEIPEVSPGPRSRTGRLFEQIEYMEQHPDIFFK